MQFLRDSKAFKAIHGIKNGKTGWTENESFTDSIKTLLYFFWARFVTFDIFTAVAIAPLRAWDLTRSSFFFPYCQGNPRNMPSSFPWWLRSQQIPKDTVITIICDGAVMGLFSLQRLVCARCRVDRSLRDFTASVNTLRWLQAFVMCHWEIKTSTGP